MSMIKASRGKRLVVIGGGLSGLSYVHYLRNFLLYYKKTGTISKITLLEANDYMGGSVKSNVFEDGIVHELGPRSARYAGVKAKNTVVLLDQLGLSDRIMAITADSAAGSERYIYRDKKFWKVPSSILQPFQKIPATNTRMIKAVFNDLFKRKKFDASNYFDNDPPIYDFIAYRFGADAADGILDPLLRGITAGDAKKLSTKALFNDLYEKEQRYGSILKGFFKPPVTKMTHDELYPHDILESELITKLEKNGTVSYNLSSGLQTLPEHLSNSLLNSNDDNVIDIYNQTKVLEVNFNDEESSENPCSVKVETIDGDKLVIEADQIVACVPATQLARILPLSMPNDQKNALKYISEIPHVPVGCVTVEYRNLSQDLPKVLTSFGFLTHSKACSQVLGISFDSSMFPQMGQGLGSVRLTCMMGGQNYEEIFKTADTDKVTNTQLEQIALEEISKTLGIKVKPFRISTHFWQTGIAQYRPGHVARLKEVRSNIEALRLPLTILGQSYDGVAINDVIYAARIAANDLVKTL